MVNMFEIISITCDIDDDKTVVNIIRLGNVKAIQI